MSWHSPVIDRKYGKWSRHLLFMLCLSVFPSAEAEDNDISEVFPNGRHRLDLDWTRVGGFDGNTYVARPGYTYSYDYHLRLSARTTVMRVEFDDDDPAAPEAGTETGLGDTVLSVQYDPDGNLTASRWIPNTIGLYGAVLAPTGSAEKGLSGDAWAGIIGAGWLQEMPGNFWLVPDVSYMRSFSHGDLGVELDQAAVNLGLYWLFPNSTWLGITPTLGWDRENSESFDGIKLVFGKAFSNGLSVFLEWGSQERQSPFHVRDDELLVLGVGWQFGQPPRD